MAGLGTGVSWQGLRHQICRDEKGQNLGSERVAKRDKKATALELPIGVSSTRMKKSGLKEYNRHERPGFLDCL